MSKKIRKSNMMKYPYTVIIGDNERDNNQVSYRHLGSDRNNTCSIDEFVELIKDEIKKR